MKRTSFTIDEEVLKKAKQLAIRDDTSISEICRTAIQAYVANEDIEENIEELKEVSKEMVKRTKSERIAKVMKEVKEIVIEFDFNEEESWQMVKDQYPRIVKQRFNDDFNEWKEYVDRLERMRTKRNKQLEEEIAKQNL